MLGAGVLILALVVFGPVLLDGQPDDSSGQPLPPGQREDELQTRMFRVGEAVPPAVGEPSSPATVAVPVAPAQAKATDESPPRAPEADAAPTPPVGLAPGTAVSSGPAMDVPAVADAPGPAAADSSPAAGDGRWIVQVGVFGQKANADRLARDLAQRGFDVSVNALDRGGRTFHRVRVGPAGSREDAAAISRRLASAGHNGRIVAE